MYIVFHSRPYLVPRDLEPFFSTPSEVKDAFGMLDSNASGEVSLPHMVTTIVEIYQVGAATKCIAPVTE